jgi:hypothetical protein
LCLPGDIVVCSSPIDPHSTIVSRLRAVPGQQIQMEQQLRGKPTHMQVSAASHQQIPCFLCNRILSSTSYQAHTKAGTRISSSLQTFCWTLRQH